MMIHPTISIIVPVYNVQDQLRECLDSIINQTFKDFECILVDDGSTDGSNQICFQYAKRDSRLKVFMQENAGLSAARNRAMSEAKGEYVSFVDSDDYLMPNYFEVMLSLMKDYDADIVKCDYYKGSLNNGSSESEICRMSGKEFTEKLLTDKIGSQLWQYLFKRYLWDGIESPLGRYAQDMMILHCVTNRANNIVVTSEKLYFYFIDRSDSTSNAKKKKAKGAFDRAIAFMMRYEFAKEYGYDEHLSSIMINVINFYNNALTLMKKGQTQFDSDIVTLSSFLKRYRSTWIKSKLDFKHIIIGLLEAYCPHFYSSCKG